MLFEFKSKILLRCGLSGLPCPLFDVVVLLLNVLANAKKKDRRDNATGKGRPMTKNQTKKHAFPDNSQGKKSSSRRREDGSEGSKKARARTVKSRSQADVFCSACVESYCEPPTEDWI